jgi:uncharacterized glyoxalase superfamily protein PhnB
VSSPPHVKKATPILVVDALEPCLPFWTDALGFEVTVTVPHGDDLGFAILLRGDAEIMLQSVASVADDVPAMASRVGGQTTTLFVEVDDLDAALEAVEGMAGVETVVPRRTTFYGMDEIFFTVPGGTVVGLAATIDGD